MQVIRKEGIFRLFDRQATLILTDEKQLERIAEDPDAPLFDDEARGHSGETHGLYPPGTTLRTFCADAAARGCDRIEVSYDFFFGGTTRENYPDSPLTVRAFRVVHDIAAEHGMAFGASLISPLDIGGGYAQAHDDTGFTYQFQEGAIVDGAFSVPMVQQRQWYNNKGPIQLQLVRAHALAFDEEQLGDSDCFYVDPDAIEDISDAVRVDVDESSYALSEAGWGRADMVLSGRTATTRARVLAVAVYRTPELDYFAPNAAPYMHAVIDQHADAGIRYGGFYSDEMHIQFDWDLTHHFGRTEIVTRYLTPHLISEYADRYGERYRDFLRYLVYFSYHQHGFLPGDEGERNAQHVFGRTARDVYETWLFRKRYFELLSRRVVDLSLDALRYAEERFGAPIMTRAHATWQESPTCDRFFAGDAYSAMAPGTAATASRYDYLPDYQWSSSIREAMSACYDYFRWNEFLTGSGNDHPEGGNADRNYYAQALACSFGVLNRYPYAYCGSWGSPEPVLRRLRDVGAAYGTPAHGFLMGHGFVQGLAHRVSDVLMLYPLELNYAQERFGSWMVQFGYADMITEEKLLEHVGGVEDGRLRVKDRTYRAVVVPYEPFVDPRTIDALRGFAEQGGTVLWMATPAVLGEDAQDVQPAFLELFGLNAVATHRERGGERVTFEGALAGIAPMLIPTNLLPDYVYPVTPGDGEVVARIGDAAIGVCRRVGRGRVAYIGCRLRDDQSQSTGEDVSTLFDALCALGGYAEDSTERTSRPASARYVVQRFPNGTVSLANHYRTFAENWYGTYFRDEARDAALLAGRTLPPIEVALDGQDIGGHAVRYRGTGAMSYRIDASGALLGFCGEETTGIEIDGVAHAFCESPTSLAFALVPADLLAEGIEAAMVVRAEAAARLTLPNPVGAGACVATCSLDWYRADVPVEASVTADAVRIDVTKELAGKWILVYRAS